MDLALLQDRKVQLESSLKNIEQSFHVVTGHLAEVNYQMSQFPEPACMDVTPIDNGNDLPVE